MAEGRGRRAEDGGQMTEGGASVFGGIGGKGSVAPAGAFDLLELAGVTALPPKNQAAGGLVAGGGMAGAFVLAEVL